MIFIFYASNYSLQPAVWGRRKGRKEGSELCMVWGISVATLMVLWNTILKPQQPLKIVNRQT